MTIETEHREKLRKIYNEVLLNYKAQTDWLANVDPDFLPCIEAMMKLYDQSLTKEQWLRTGVMLGAVYEQWKQKQSKPSF